MTITSGSRYFITNKKAGTVVDLDTRNYRTVHAWTRHGGANQQWEFNLVDGGWQIKNVANGQYLTFEGNPQDGQRIVCNNQPFIWHIWPDDEDKSAQRFCVPNTVQNLDLSDHGNVTPGTYVQLWSRWNGTNQVWRVDNGKSIVDVYMPFLSENFQSDARL